MKPSTLVHRARQADDDVLGVVAAKASVPTTVAAARCRGTTEAYVVTPRTAPRYELRQLYCYVHTRHRSSIIKRGSTVSTLV